MNPLYQQLDMRYWSREGGTMAPDPGAPADATFDSSFSPDLTGSVQYWEHRYRVGKRSGRSDEEAERSRRVLEWRADLVAWLARHYGLATVVDFGVGDGDQLSHYLGPLQGLARVLGLDVSPTVVGLLRERFRGDRPPADNPGC